MIRKKYFLFIALFGCLGIVFIICCRYYAPPQPLNPYLAVHHHDDTVRIAYIGDSWAFLHKEHDTYMSQRLSISINRPVLVKSMGVSGLTSKEIYTHLFNDSVMRSFMLQGFDYCFVSAGINDTRKKMSTSYYKESMDYIIQFLLQNHIHPIIMEIPDYDILKNYERQKTSRKIIRQISMMINATPLDCKQMYRDALKELILEKGYRQNVSVIRYKEWNTDFENDLKRLYIEDGMHLNEEGYARLDSCIVNHIMNIH